jgi:hypothetical protein
MEKDEGEQLDLSCDEVLLRVKGGRNIVHTIKRRKGNWIGYILGTKFFLKHIIEKI